jgi:glycosyltransferase involved in cell wall biosynthesis
MISIIMIFYNDAQFIGKAINSILNQSYKNFELIIINDYSTDSAPEIVKSYKDKRIRLFHNTTNLGIAKSRNIGIQKAKGKYIFFTDSDCVADKDWLKRGIETFRKNNCLGVEGKIYYFKRGYEKTVSDKLPGSINENNQFMGCNIAYTSQIMRELNGFDSKYKYHDDKEFAIRALERGKICKNNDMIITHQKKFWTPKSFIQSAKRVHDRILLFKYHNTKQFILWRILFPKNLIKMLFPPLIIITLIKNKPKTWLDMKLIFASYIFCVYQRYCIWKGAIKEKVFII